MSQHAIGSSAAHSGSCQMPRAESPFDRLAEVSNVCAGTTLEKELPPLFSMQAAVMLAAPACSLFTTPRCRLQLKLINRLLDVLTDRLWSLVEVFRQSLDPLALTAF